jgi:choline dehydrogenase
MLSGIGPAAHLKEVGIPVAVDLPGVGQNLQDHLVVPVAYACTQPITLASAETVWNVLKYVLLRRGPLTSNVAEAGGFVKTRPELSAPDVQFHFGPVYFLNHGLSRPQGHGFTLGPTPLRPRSRGRIFLRSAEALQPPAIQPNYLDCEQDLQTLIEGVKLARRLAGAKAFHGFRGAETYPGPGVQSDAALAEYVRSHAETLYHPAGTCKMGTDPRAVVDPRLQVHGVPGLRVVDASILPTLVSGNTNAPTIMIAEKAADLIKAD